MKTDPNLAQEALKHRLDELPDRFSFHIKNGFHLLSRLSDQQKHEFLSYILTITEKGENLDRDRAVHLSGLDGNTVTDALTAIAMVIGATVDIDISVQDFLLYGEGKVFNSEDAAVAKLVADTIISSRTTLESGMQNSALANSVLPSFKGVYTEVDFRLRFDKNSDIPTGGVPIAVCNLKTDATDDAWFQASLSDLEGIVERLSKTIDRMRAVEAAVQVKP